MDTVDAATPVASIRVWDRFVRVFHWTLVACILVNCFVFDDGEDLHQRIGYAACAWVAARIVWGFIGSAHARFADFFPTPARLRAHVSLLRQGRLPFHPGHNPLGALMMLALLGLVLLLGLSGWAQTTDAYFGVEWVQDAHQSLANGLIGLAGLHAAAAIVMGRLERVNLVRAMVTGIKIRH